MTHKERILNTMKLQPADRIPWVPFVGVHGAHLLNIGADEYLRSADHIVDGVDAAIEAYDPDGVPVAFDLQIEAEALGCTLQWSDNSPPAVVSHPILEGTSIGSLKVPECGDGRIGLVVEAAGRLRKSHPDRALYGLITGPFTLALHLLGTDIFMNMLTQPDSIHELLRFTTKSARAMAGYYIEAGCDVVAVVDPMTSQIDPDSFETFVSGYARELFDYIRTKGALGSFFVCGHAQQNIEAMCNCTPDNISIDENIPLDYVKEKALERNISFGGNMKLTTVLLMGSEEDAQHEALECIDLGGATGFILAPGCDLPMKTPPANLKAVTKLVQDPYQRDVVRTLEKKEQHLEILNMRDYGQSDRVIVDVITLDSESCAPCQYMVEAVKRVAPHFEGLVEWREHPIKKLEAVSFMSSLMVKNIPTICIDGKIAFVSRIPPRDDLIRAIQRRINEKLTLKLRARGGEILVFGKTAEECSQVSDLLKKAMAELGKEVKFEVITDESERISMGVVDTPALVVVEYKLKFQGALPPLEVVKEWIKDI
jgi:uroporphyrinogen decarboxylase